MSSKKPQPHLASDAPEHDSAEHGEKIHLIGVRENNLKNLSLTFDHGKMIAITGVSGSGKSTLAFDTIYAEGGRRYIETFSPYTRQFLDRLHRPDVDTVSGIRPALALEQRNRVTNSRSTVGTVTEINDYLKIIWSHLGTIICPNCQIPVQRNTARIVSETLQHSALTAEDGALVIAFPLQLSGESSIESLAITLQHEGFVRYFSEATNSIARLEGLASDADAPRTLLPVVVDRFDITAIREPSEELRERLITAIHQAYAFGHGTLLAIHLLAPTASRTNGHPSAKLQKFSHEPVCSSCDARCSIQTT